MSPEKLEELYQEARRRFEAEGGGAGTLDQHAEQVKRAIGCLEAAYQLEEKPVPVEDVLTAAKVIEAGRVRLFLSYKHKDEERAFRIRDDLKGLFRKKLEIVCDKTFHPGDGKGLRGQIVDAILGCQWFLLLLPDPSAAWDWPLFESGIFAPRLKSKLYKVFILHHSDNPPPDQFKDIITAVATRGDHRAIEVFLRIICLEEEFFPGMGQLCEGIRDTEIPEAAARINAQIVREAPLVRHCQPWVHLTLPQTGEPLWRLEDDKLRDLLDRSEVQAINDKCLNIFGLTGAERPRTWADLVGRVLKTDPDERWVEEVMGVLRRLAEGDPIERSAHARFHAIPEKRPYRPVLSRIDFFRDQGQKLLLRDFRVLFLESVAAHGEIRGPDVRGYTEIFASMKQSHRFAWEVVAPFKARPFNHEAVVELREAYYRVMQEYESRAQYRLEELAQFFDEKKERVEQLYTHLMEFGRKLTDLIREDRLSNEKRMELERLLGWFEPLNLEYLHLSSAWVARVNADLFDKTRP